MEIFLGICGSGLFAALAAIFAPILLEKLKYKHVRQEKQEEKEQKKDSMAFQINELSKDIKNYKDETTKQFSELNYNTSQKMDTFENNLSKIAETTDALVKNEVARTYVAIRRQALSAIKAGYITAGDLERLLAEYERYKRLPNANGFLTETIKQAKQLKVVVEDEDLE